MSQATRLPLMSSPEVNFFKCLAFMTYIHIYFYFGFIILCLCSVYIYLYDNFCCVLIGFFSVKFDPGNTLLDFERIHVEDISKTEREWELGKVSRR